jgi:hypothetical protein
MQKSRNLGLAVFCIFLAVAPVFAAVVPVRAATSPVSPSKHIEVKTYPWTKPVWSGGIQVTEIWYRVTPNTCSTKDILVARVTLQFCQYTITTCYGYQCITKNTNYCQDFLQNTINAVVKGFYQSVTVLVIIGPPIVVTIPYWAPLLL